MKKTILLAVALLAWANVADARPRHHYSRIAYSTGEVVGGRPAGCPYAFCGCGVSIRVFGRIIPELNLAANWFRFPRARPAPGMVAVRRHHVFYIEAVLGSGLVRAYDPNSGGHKTRRHVISLAGYSVHDPSGEARRAATKARYQRLAYHQERF